MFDPLDQPVIERDYTTGNFAEGTEPQQEAAPPKDLFGGGQPSSGASDSAPPPKFEQAQQQDTVNEGEKKDLPPHIKRKYAEQTADLMLHGYCSLIPIPYTKVCQFNTAKLEAYVIQGVLDMTIALEGGQTIEDYIKNFNSDIEKRFIVSDETKGAIREPLIEVLMEKGAVMTPMQRLLVALMIHQIQCLGVVIEVNMAKKSILDAFIDYTARRKDQTLDNVHIARGEKPKKETGGEKFEQFSDEEMASPTVTVGK